MKDKKVFTIEWLKAAGIRAVKTLAQTAVLNEVDWVMVASASGLTAILSLLTSVAGLPDV